MDTIIVNLGDRSYPIYFANSNLIDLGKVLAKLDLSDRVGIITNPTVGKLFLNTVEESLKTAGFTVSTMEIPDGEEYKTLEWAGMLYDKLISLKMDRKSILVALGGGVVGDITGFVAATFLRGIPFVQVPTTLLAQVDSSVGGKTGVNHPKGKNLIGVFNQPKLVLIDIGTLKSLHSSELISGLAEVIKYGIIWDSDLFEYLEENMEKILRLEEESVLSIVKRCCSIKARIVEEDEKEGGLRSILNFGHTIGHAVEALTDFKSYKHGEAVAIGMAAAARLSVELGGCIKDVPWRIDTLIQRAGLPSGLPQFPGDEYVKALKLDKKMGRGKVKFVLTENIGRVKFMYLSAEEIVNNLSHFFY